MDYTDWPYEDILKEMSYKKSQIMYNYQGRKIHYDEMLNIIPLTRKVIIEKKTKLKFSYYELNYA